MPPSVKTPPTKKPLETDDVEQAIREILRVATLWSANRRAGVAPSTMAYHEDFLRSVCEPALRHWSKLPLKRPSRSKVVLRSFDFLSYSVLLHVMDALDQYRPGFPASKTNPDESDRAHFVHLIQAAMPVLGRDKVLRDTAGRTENKSDGNGRAHGNPDHAPAGAATDNGSLGGMGDIERVLERFEKETDKEKKLERSLRRTAGTIVKALGGASSTKLSSVGDVVEREGPLDLKGSPYRPLVTRRQLEERENGRHVSYKEIREFAFRLLGLSTVTPQTSATEEEVPANVDDTIEPDLPDNIRVLVEKSRQDAQARAKHLSKYPSSKGFPLIGDDDVAPLTHQPTQRKSPRRASQRNRRG